MQRTKIEWVRNPDGSPGYTWNPCTGCLHGCEYCYAARIDKRFGDGRFTPTFHLNRLQDPLKVKKPNRIFVGSVSDLFGDWKWKYDDGAGWMHRELVVAKMLGIVKQCPQHIFIFLTKNPKGMQGFDFPTNCWCGTSVENQERADERMPELLKVNCKTLFVSYEPALGLVELTKYLTRETPSSYRILSRFYGPNGFDPAGSQPEKSTIRGIGWLIIGAQTGPGAVKPNPEWIELAIDQCRSAGVPKFVKDNCNWPEQIREFPWVLT